MAAQARTHHIWLQMILGLAAAALAGVLLHGFWELFGLPDQPGAVAWGELVRPWGLRRFVSVALPAAAVLPTLVLGVISLMVADQGAPLRDHCRQAQRFDAYAYLLLAAGVVQVLVWNVLGNGMLALGLIYLGLTTLKSAILLRLAWQVFLAPAAARGNRLGRHGLVGVFLAALVAFALPAPWISQVVSAGGGETLYLGPAHKLAGGPPALLRGPQQQRHQGFYWRGGEPERLNRPGGAATPLFSLIITPAYALVGRLGVLLLQAGFMALSAVTLLSWLGACGVRAGPAAAAAGLSLAAAPVFIAGGLVLPEALAALLALCGLRLLAWAREHPWSALPLIIAASLLLAALDLRFTALAGGLLLLGFFELLRHSLGRVGAALAVAAPVAALALAVLGPWGWPASLASALADNAAWWHQALYWWTPLAAFGGGLFLDQAQGLFFTAPMLLIALGGLPVSLKRRTAASLHYLIPAVLHLAAVGFTGWYRWHGGMAPPGLLAVVILPPLALFMAPVMAALARPWWRLALWVPAGAGLFYTWLLTLLPWMRLTRPGMKNPLLLQTGRNLGLDLTRSLPSGFGVWADVLPALAVTVFSAAFYAVCAWRLPAPPGEAPRWRANEALAMALCLALCAWVLVLGQRPLP
ncbi:MAG: hypothetical protein K9K66_15220 [Desulfarculaceae bacterium]|nr:hypothetical protein [Desulfarculaceae bacterium]MCF8074235.1 hypothetical protein [Desulfarculaceae bacterium]MCF8103006.1 hypothetical protein [Desulfarculaceae bacterium]MCF8117137.1 hypothetical protein [Desulfarculaceae bacterium]